MRSSQAQYYQWRDQFSPTPPSVRAGCCPTRQGRLERENARLKNLVGDSPWSSKREDTLARRGPYAKVVERNAQLLERIRDLKAEHPFWGYRRIWADLRYVHGLIVNQKRIYGVMKVADLRVKPNLKLRARRKVGTTKPRPTWPTSGGASI